MHPDVVNINRGKALLEAGNKDKWILNFWYLGLSFDYHACVSTVIGLPLVKLIGVGVSGRHIDQISHYDRLTARQLETPMIDNP